MSTALLILHGVAAVALLGAITHQLVSVVVQRPARGRTFVARYAGVSQSTFTNAVIALYLVTLLLGGVIYPTYRLEVRVPFEEMSLGWAVGVFELKEHFGGIGIALLPAYAWLWRPEQAQSHTTDRIAFTAIVALIVWWDFLVGHILNNIRGLP